MPPDRPTSAKTDGPYEVLAPWVVPYEPNAWTRTLPAWESAGVPDFVVIFGCVMAVGLVAVLHFCPPEVRQVHPKVPVWSQFAGVSSIAVVLMLVIVIIGTQTGSLRAAADDSWQKVGTAKHAVELVKALNESGFALQRELGDISRECPSFMQQRIGASVVLLEEKLGNFSSNMTSLAAVVAPMPTFLSHLSSRGNAAAARLARFFGLSTLLVMLVLCAVNGAALDVHFNKGSLLRRLGQYSDFELPAIEIALAASTIALSWTAGTEISIGGDVAGSCQGADSVLRSVEGDFSGNSTALAALRYYLFGQSLGSGQNPMGKAFAVAQETASHFTQWMHEYSWAIHKFCPEWNNATVAQALGSMRQRVNETEALLEPETVYSHYRDHVQLGVCDGFVPTVGFLVVLQTLLAWLALPCLAFAVRSFLLESANPSNKEAAYSQLKQDDSHSLDDSHDGEEHEDLIETTLQYAYYGVFGFAAIIFIIGLFMYMLPSKSISRRIVGTLLFGCGVFLVTNSDLIVTYLRLHHQVEVFKANNDRFEKSLKTMGAEVSKLTKAANGLNTIEKMFQGNVKRAVEEVDRMGVTQEADIKMCLKDLMRLYGSKGETIRFGAPLEEMFSVFRSVFADAVVQYECREHKVQSALMSHSYYKKEQRVSQRVLAALMSNAIMKDPSEIDKIGGSAEKILNKAVSKDA